MIARRAALPPIEYGQINFCRQWHLALYPLYLLAAASTSPPESVRARGCRRVPESPRTTTALSGIRRTGALAHLGAWHRANAPQASQ